MDLCEYCGSEVAVNARSCPGCGAAVMHSQSGQQQRVEQSGVNAQPLAQPPMYQHGQPTKSKVVAALLAIFLGSVGIHKFYLGANTAGMIMLVLSVLSCGSFAALMGTISLIEGIVYLTKTDEQFYQEYEVHCKQWF